MDEIIGVPSGHIGTGSTLLLTDKIPLATAAVRTSAIIDTLMAGKIGIDISADQACTVKLVRLPDGETPGEVSDIGSVTADTPAFFLYTSLLCPAIKVVVENTGGADMTEFAMYVRGGA